MLSRVNITHWGDKVMFSFAGTPSLHLKSTFAQSAQATAEYSPADASNGAVAAGNPKAIASLVSHGTPLQST